MKQLPQALHDAKQQKGVTKCDAPAGEVFLDEDLSPDVLLSLWHDFADISINDWDEIEKPFMHYPAGTYCFDIWHWFDERWPAVYMNCCFCDGLLDIPDRCVPIANKEYPSYQTFGRRYPARPNKCQPAMTCINAL